MKLRYAALLVVVVATAWPQRGPATRPVRMPSRGTRAAIAAGTEHATEAGMRMYYGGGNAVDAGISAMFAAAVTEFSHFGMGGESPILIRTKDGKVHAIAGVGTMPKLATADYFRNHKIKPDEIVDAPEKNGLKEWIPVAGVLPALVPGMVEAGLVALREYGTKSFADIVQPAIDLADGFPLDELRAFSLQTAEKHVSQWPTAKRVWMPNGRVMQPGEIFRQPDLARTLRAMAAAEKKAAASGASRVKAIDAVRDYFYRGEIAHKIDEFMKASGGLLRYEDMAAFRLQPEEPVSTTFRGYTVYKPGFWTQGPTFIETLNILDGIDLPALKFNSAEYIHTVAEALKLAYADRDTYYGDPKFTKIPAERLLSKEYGAERRKQIATESSHEFRPGSIDGVTGKHPFYSQIERHRVDPAVLAKDTTCIDAIDKDGVAIAITPSGAWLPSVIAGDTGIPLTQRAQSFLLVRGHPNELAPGKRPRVTLSPTLAVGPNGQILTMSTPGGDVQEQSLLQVFLYATVWGFNAQQAVEAPRFQTEHLVASFDNHAMGPGTLLLDERTPPTSISELQKRKHLIEMRSRYASGSAPVLVRFLPIGLIEAGADPFYYRASQAW
jgi:gamma-glutamyltranspeptidase / glutathione hydrolase